uniref:Uncharacterized protein n=1 Tax=Rhizophagus irregularis (strain DAOM 181602 / DAOM 197198 / MUCL 43194) TaxID=747089 RepID=U9SQ86_RHIID
METVDYIEAFEKLPGPIEYLSSMSGHAEILIIRSFHWYRLEQPISRDSWKSRLVTRKKPYPEGGLEGLKTKYSCLRNVYDVSRRKCTQYLFCTNDFVIMDEETGLTITESLGKNHMINFCE